MRNETAIAALLVVALLWAGALLGVSFLATPVKFLAPSLSLPVALDVGRQTYRWFSRFELLLALAALGSALFAEMPRVKAKLRRADPSKARSAGSIATPLAAMLLMAVAVQGIWLLPLLDARVEIILQGGTSPPSHLHNVYVVIEALKLGALVVAEWTALAGLRGGAGEAD